MNYTYDEMRDMLIDLRYTLSYYFMATGVNSMFHYDSYRSGAADKKMVVKFRKFMTNGHVIKPGYSHADINRNEGFYCDNSAYAASDYYAYYPTIFPRFYYKRQELVDIHEHGGSGIRTKAVFGKLAFSIDVDGSVEFFADNNAGHYDVRHDLYKSTLEELVQKIPECNRIMEIIKAHCIHPMKRCNERTAAIKDELQLDVLNRQQSRRLSEGKTEGSEHDPCILQ